ncbi:SAV_2336 N-terminal domain-related protein [Kitasatospora sp. NPDC058965]|uniref:SAV_2336 N-terminal domain-related protein n=1 Tax=Kitasatospora sp. NPDC058965 TaxID=3346682 RepID=UPI0036A71C83
MTDEDGLGRLAALLRSLEPDAPAPTPREVAELVWLAGRLPRGAIRGAAAGPDRRAARPGPSAEPSTEPEQPAAAEEPQQEAEPPAPEAEDGSRVYLPEAAAPGAGAAPSGRAGAVRVAGAAVLPRRRELAGALKPLKRRVPSGSRTVLDEDATADRAAQDARWLPVLVPAMERWLDLALIVDEYGEAAALWEPVGRELSRVFAESGAFRDIRTYRLRPRADGSPALARGAQQALHTPATSIGPTGRTVTLVLTDGVDPAWSAPELRGALRRWARNGPTAVLHTLPEHLWAQTALAPEPGRFRSTGAGAANALLRYTPYALGADGPRAGAVPVPVLGIQPEWLAPWARATASAGAYDGAAVLLGPPDECAATAPPAGDRAVRFADFLAQADPRVFRLAAYLTAAPLNLPVMRLVQSAMFPGSPPSDLAEIVFSGLLHQVPGGAAAAAADPLRQAYAFAPGVREQLLSTLRGDEADQVVAVVSAHLARTAPAAAARFTAAVADPDGRLQLPGGARHWARTRGPGRRRHPRGEAAGAVRWPGAGRRFLITIGVPRSRDAGSADPAATDPGAHGRTAFDDPGDLARDVARVRAAFEGLGYLPVLPELAAGPDSEAVLRSVDAWVDRAGLGPEDAVAVYFAGHAVVTPDGETTLLLGDNLSGKAWGLTVAALHRAFAGGIGGLMLLLDTCAGPRPGRSMLERPELWVLAHLAGVAETGPESAFVRALTRELADLRGGSVPPPRMAWELAARLDERLRLERSAAPAEPPRSGTVSWYSIGRAAVSFFPEPTPDCRQQAVALWAEQSDALRRLVSWLGERGDDHRPRVLVGGPGTGKSTILAELAGQVGDWTTPALAHRTPVLLQVSAMPTVSRLRARLAARLGLPDGTGAQLLERLRGLPAPLLIALDGFDEAPPRERERIVAELLGPLAEVPTVRLVLGTRPVPRLGLDAEVIGLGATNTGFDMALIWGDEALARFDYGMAGHYFREALAVGERRADHRQTAPGHERLGRLAEYQGDFAGAERHYREALAGYRHLGDDSAAAVGRALDGLGPARLVERCLARSAVSAEYLVDVANVVHTQWIGPDAARSLERFRLVVQALVELTGDRDLAVFAVVDRSLRASGRGFEDPRDRHTLRRWVAHGLVEEVTLADARILDLADALGLPVVSGDWFLDHRDDYPWIQGDTGGFLAPRPGHRRGPVLLVANDMRARATRARPSGRPAPGRSGPRLVTVVDRHWSCPEPACRVYDAPGGPARVPLLRDGVPTCERHGLHLVDLGPRPAAALLKVMVRGECASRFTVEEGTRRTVGRTTLADIDLGAFDNPPESRTLSREHLVIEATDGILTVRDTSTNGSRLRIPSADGQFGDWERLPRQELRHFAPRHEVELVPGLVLTRSGRSFPAELDAARGQGAAEV